MSLNSSALFITYDGLLDPLGGSQILPYLRSIATHPRHLHVISFEKSHRLFVDAESLRNELSLMGIEWTPLPFTAGLGKFGKLWDLARMYATALRLQLTHHFVIAHCRSYQAMQVGCLLKRLTDIRTLFDMRGLWVDERIDGRIWSSNRILDRLAFQQYKRIERRLLDCANHVVALTERVVPELHKLSPNMTATVTVIPCCADFDHFTLPTTEQRIATRSRLGISADDLVLSYLGSLGTWYMIEEMLAFFSAAARQRNDVKFLLITRDWQPEHEHLIENTELKEFRKRILVHPASRNEVPMLLGCSDIMLSFIKPAYSKMASSPTKLAEAFALGVPVISNSGIGDVDNITNVLEAGVVLDLADQMAVSALVDDLEKVKKMGGQQLRVRARAVLGLEVAEDCYRRVYQQLEMQR